VVTPGEAPAAPLTCKVECQDKLVEAYRYAVEYSRTSKAIVEEYVDGREFSVEYISHQGKQNCSKMPPSTY
jgi:hypothetical protein